MITNYFKTAFRSTVKRKGYSILNIAGLTIGMTCCLLIFHYVSYERSYDRFQTEGDRIYRIRLDVYQKGTLAYRSATSYPAIAPTMKKDFPEVEDYCRLIDNNLLLANEEKDKKFIENKGYYADPSTIKMFGLQMMKGDAKTALEGPDKIILSQSTAEKYFGSEQPVGKVLVNRASRFSQTFQVTGVYKDIPATSHLLLPYLVSYATLGKELRLQGDSSNASETAWGWYDFYAYVQLKEGTDPKQVESKLPAFASKYINSQDYNKNNNNRSELHLTPLRDIHLYSNFNQEAEVNGNGRAVSSLFLIAILIICIAWINYINLATARAVERAREVGVRKVLGALRTSLIKQFMTESLLLNLFSVLLSLSLFFALLTPFDLLTGKATSVDGLMSGEYWLLFFSLFLAGTLLSGLYPAFVLSRFKPVLVLKGAFKNTSKGQFLRKGLIIAQFVTSIVLIGGTITVYQQMKYMRTRDIGADIDQTIVLRGPQTLADSLYQNTYQPFKRAVLQQPGIKSMAASSDVIGNEIYWTRGAKRVGVDGATSVTLYNLGVDYDFIPAYGMKLMAGRNFSIEHGTDNKAIILNEKATTLLGFKDASSAVGQKVWRGGDTATVIGVTADFHQVGLQKPIDPIVFNPRPNMTAFYSVKLSGGDLTQTITTLKQLWETHFPKDAFNYFFLDESFGEQYKADLLFGKVFGIFSFLAILIACFGLLGLSAYNVLQKTKEIGIRKVLGASANSLFLLLSKEFLKLVVIALFVALPMGWYVMHEWLQDYAYRITIAWWVFGLAGLIAVLIAILTISINVGKALIANPVNSLRTE